MVDYTKEGFIEPMELGEIKGYASINSVMYREEDGLAPTGNYFVYLLHPTMGSTHFGLERTGDEDRPWNRTGGAFWLNDEIVNGIIEEIEIRKIKIALNV